MQARIDVVNRVLREQIAGIRVVRAFVREPLETRRFAEANSELTDTAVRAGRLMALMFPTVMLVLNASSVAVLWFGAHRVNDGDIADRRTDRVPQLPDADPVLGDDGDLHGRHGAAGLGQRRPDHRGAGHRILGGAAGIAVTPADQHRRLSSSTPSSSATRAPSEPVLRDITLRARPGHHDGDHRIDRRGQDHAAVADPPAVRRHRRHGHRRRRRRPRLRSGNALGPHRAGAAEAVPVHRNGRVQPALRQPGRHRRGAVDGAGPSRRPRISSRAMPDGLDSPITQGGSNVSGGQRQRLAIARALVARARTSTCSTTRSRRWTWPPTPGCGPRCKPTTRDGR